jgi:hypothetical protein
VETRTLEVEAAAGADLAAALMSTAGAKRAWRTVFEEVWAGKVA